MRCEMKAKEHFGFCVCLAAVAVEYPSQELGERAAVGQCAVSVHDVLLLIKVLFFGVFGEVLDELEFEPFFVDVVEIAPMRMILTQMMRLIAGVV